MFLLNSLQSIFNQLMGLLIKKPVFEMRMHITKTGKTTKLKNEKRTERKQKHGCRQKNKYPKKRCLPWCLLSCPNSFLTKKYPAQKRQDECAVSRFSVITYLKNFIMDRAYCQVNMFPNISVAAGSNLYTNSF